MNSITDTERLNALKKFLFVDGVDCWEKDAMLKMSPAYFQGDGDDFSVDAALDYLVMETLQSNP